MVDEAAVGGMSHRAGRRAGALAVLAALAALAALTALAAPRSAVVLSPVTDKESMPEYAGATLFKGVPLLDLRARAPAPAEGGAGGGDSGAGVGQAGGQAPRCLIGVYCPPEGWASVWHRLVSRMQKEMSTDTMEIANLKNQVRVSVCLAPCARASGARWCACITPALTPIGLHRGERAQESPMRAGDAF